MFMEDENPMDDFNELFKQFVKSYEAMSAFNKKMNREQSEMDTKLSDIYHQIEGFNPKHVSQSHHLYLKLQKILRKRRLIKGAKAQVAAVLSGI